MNSISGKVVVRESGVGIPDLLVVVYDLDPNNRPEEFFDVVTTPLKTARPSSGMGIHFEISLETQ